MKNACSNTCVQIVGHKLISSNTIIANDYFVDQCGT